MDSQIPYFCGDTEECRTLGSRKALETAKANIESTFEVVGVLEELDMTHKVMTCLNMPIMQGLDTCLHRCWSVCCQVSSPGWPRSTPSTTCTCTATTRTQRSSGEEYSVNAKGNSTSTIKIGRAKTGFASPILIVQVLFWINMTSS